MKWKLYFLGIFFIKWGKNTLLKMLNWQIYLDFALDKDSRYIENNFWTIRDGDIG